LGIVGLIILVRIGDAGLSSRVIRFAGPTLYQLCIPVQELYEDEDRREEKGGVRGGGEKNERRRRGERDIHLPKTISFP